MSLNTLPVGVIVTAENCGHCNKMRGDGRLLSSTAINREKTHPTLPGGNYFDEVFMIKLITGNSKQIPAPIKYRIYNIHMNDFNNPNSGVKSISFFTLSPDKPGAVIERIFSKGENEKTNIETLIVGSLKNIKEETKSEIKWIDTVNSYIPKEIVNYILFYPQSAVFSAKSWDMAIKGEKSLYGFVNGLKTKDTAPYSVIREKQPQQEDPIAFFQSYVDGTRELPDSPVLSIVQQTTPKEVKTTPKESPEQKTADVVRMSTGCQGIGYIINSIS